MKFIGNVRQVAGKIGGKISGISEKTKQSTTTHIID